MSSVTIIDPMDSTFYNNGTIRTTGNHHALWQPEACEAITETLRGVKVMIVVDTATGHTLVDAEITGWSPTTRHGTRPGLYILHRGATRPMLYSTWNIGAIIPMEEPLGRTPYKYQITENIRSNRRAAATR